MILVDTTVLVYAVGDLHSLRDPCRRLFTAQADGSIDAATTIEVIQEFVHVRARRRSRPDAVELGHHYLAALSLITVDAADLDLGLSLFSEHTTLGAFDSVLAAVALERRADALISADRAFQSVPGLTWIEPGTAAFNQLLNG